MKRSPLVVIFTTVFIDLLGFGIVIPVLPFYAEGTRFNATPRTVGLLFASYSIMQLIFSPVLAAIAVAIRLTSKGPVLFRQERLGQYGQTFTFLKFRSLYPSVFFVVVHYQPIFAEDSTKSCARARVEAHASVTSKNIYDSNRMRGKTMTVLMQPLH